MNRIWLHRMRHRFIVVTGSLALLVVASGIHLKSPTLQTSDVRPIHHSSHNGGDNMKAKERIFIYRVFQIRKLNGDLKTRSSSAS